MPLALAVHVNVVDAGIALAVQVYIVAAGIVLAVQVYVVAAGIVLAVQDEKRIISATWAKDEDIGRFLRSLPNWRSLKDDRRHVMSEDDQRAMNSKESSVLTSNLSSGDALIPPQEIIHGDCQLHLAISHRSICAAHRTSCLV